MKCKACGGVANHTEDFALFEYGAERTKPEDIALAGFVRVSVCDACLKESMEASTSKAQKSLGVSFVGISGILTGLLVMLYGFSMERGGIGVIILGAVIVVAALAYLIYEITAVPKLKAEIAKKKSDFDNAIGEKILISDFFYSLEEFKPQVILNARNLKDFSDANIEKYIKSGDARLEINPRYGLFQISISVNKLQERYKEVFKYSVPTHVTHLYEILTEADKSMA